MQLSVRSFPQLVQDMSVALQGAAARLLDVSVGSVLRALLEANAAVALWLQYLIAQLLQVLRAATCEGSDLEGVMHFASVGLWRERAYFPRLSSMISRLRKTCGGDW